MSEVVIIVNHGFAKEPAGEPLVSIDIDGDLTLLTPIQALAMAQSLMNHAKAAMADGAAAYSAGAQQLASMHPKGSS